MTSPAARPCHLGVFVTFLALVAVGVTACDGAWSSAPTTLEGAWLGEGTFHTRAGDADVTIQLELLSDGSYRYLILEPALLAMTGMETGTWARDADRLILTPTPAPAIDPADADADAEAGGVFEALRRGSPQADRPDRTLTIADDLADLRFSSGRFNITFTPNREATAALRDAGDVVDP
ncbi:MAG: hypothetical protein WD009_12250 [Phycisphaeraceae bacterium]